MTAAVSPERTKIHLLALPVAIAARAQQHVDELIREFTLISASTTDDDDRHVPRRLMELVDVLTRQFAGINDEPRERLEAAIARGDRVIEDHVLELPPEAAPASQALGAILDEADEYCRRGQHLLTLSTPEDCLAYRRWYLAEVIDQLAGAKPTPWPESAHRLV